MQQFVQRDRGGTVRLEVAHAAPLLWDPKDAEATPAVAGPRVTLLDSGGGELVAAQDATPGPRTTLSAAASRGATSLVLAAITDISVDDVLILGPNSGGQWEWITVDSVTSATKTITLRDELSYAYASSDAVKSPKLSVSVTGAQAGEIQHNCRAEWAYEISGADYTQTTLFHISVWVPRLTLRDADVLTRQPRARDVLGTRQRLSQLISDVWTRDVLEDLASRMKPGQWVDEDSLRQAHLYRVLAEIACMAADEPGQERYLIQYRQAWERALATGGADVDDDGIISDGDIIRPAWTGRVRRSS